MESICESRLCTGCGACCQICPKGAIQMNENEEGFLYPKINGSLCNNCGICAGTCPINSACSEMVVKNQDAGRRTVHPDRDSLSQDEKASDQPTPGAIPPASEQPASEPPAFIPPASIPPEKIAHKVYACFSTDEEVRSRSSSGGVFTLLARMVLAEGGVVFGAGFDQSFKVRHEYVDKEDRLDGLRRSKYVQSDTVMTFREARAFLKEGKSVLYCGTPCQIAGLKAFLGGDYPKLLTCDLACHGVPSPKIWSMFLGFLKDRYKSNIKSVSFRDKSTGWNNSSMAVDFENGSRYMDRVKRETYFIGFGKSIFNRQSCYDCRFRLDNTRADITLADFWGIDRDQEAGFTDNKGVSLIITHTDSGEAAMAKLSGSICMKERGLDEAVRYNPRLVSSVPEPAGRKGFFDDLKAWQDFDKLRRKYMDNFSMKYKAKVLVKKLLGRA